jgi:hypothetical protein
MFTKISNNEMMYAYEDKAKRLDRVFFKSKNEYLVNYCVPLKGQ